MSYIPTVVNALYIDKYIIEIEFDNGETRVVDFECWLDGGIFEPLKDVQYFKKFIVDGCTISWPNGADVAPETLYIKGHPKAA